MSSTDNSSQLSDAISIGGDLPDFEIDQLYLSSSSESLQNTTPDSTADPRNVPAILPAGFRSAGAGKLANTSWIWQHGQEIVKIRNGASFWLCQLC